MFALNKSAFVVLEAALSLNISDDLENMTTWYLPYWLMHINGLFEIFLFNLCVKINL